MIIEAFSIPFATMHWGLVLLILLVSLVVLGVSADKLIDLMVVVSRRWGMPQVLVGATIVSLGTTLPEVMVSVMAAIQGNPGIALGNSVGSIICDTGLILGLACLLGPIPISATIKKHQGWMQFTSGLVLVAFCMPWTGNGWDTIWRDGSVLTQSSGFFFLLLSLE